AGSAQFLNERRISRDLAAVERERSGGRLHVVLRRDVVFDQKRNAVEGTADTPGLALVVQTGGNRDRVRICFDDRVQRRIELPDAIEIALDQIVCGELPRSHCGLQLRNRFLEELETAS